MVLTERINNTHVLRTYLNMIRTAPIDIVLELKQNLEQEIEYSNSKYKHNLDEEFAKRLQISE